MSHALKHPARKRREDLALSTEFIYETAFSRNIGIISPEEQTILRRKRVAIPGCGGVGGIHAIALARLGVANFALADFDTFGIENMNRQFGSKISTQGMNKAEVIKQEILEINPQAVVHVFTDGITSENIDVFLAEADLVVDGLDFFAFPARDLLFPLCQKLGIPLVTAAPLGLTAAVLVFTKDSMSYADYFNFSAGDDHLTRCLKFALGLAPKALQLPHMPAPTHTDIEARRGPSNIAGVTLCAAFVAGESFKILLGRGPVKVVPHFKQVDTYRARMRRGYLWRGNRNLWQRLKIRLLHWMISRR